MIISVTVLSQAMVLVSSGNSIVAGNFARFAANDVKSLTSCHWKQSQLSVTTTQVKNW